MHARPTGILRDPSPVVLWVFALTALAAALLSPGAARAETPASTDAGTRPRLPAADAPFGAWFTYASENDPGVRAAFESWHAALHRVSVAKGWPDPRLSYSYFLRSVETALGPQEHVLAINQMVPWFGKLSLRGVVAERAALVREHELRQARLGLLEQVAGAYFDYAYLARAIGITENTMELVRYQESVARSKYRTDTASYSDLIRAQVELGKLDEQLRNLRDRRTSTAAALNVALGRDAGAELPWPIELSLPDLPVPEHDQVMDVVLAANPALAAADGVVEEMRARIDLARRERYPDLTVGVQTVLVGESDLTSFDDSGRDAWMATVSLNLPLGQGKYGAAVDEARALERAAVSRRADLSQELGHRAERALYRVRDSERKIDLYRNGLVPKARQSMEATATAYRAGQVGFLDYLDAQRILLEFELELARASAEQGRALAAVWSLMGREPGSASAVEEEFR